MAENTNALVQEVGREAVYAQIYDEMRRYRDYEFNSSSWYTALLLATIGFLIAVRFGGTAPQLKVLLVTNGFLKLAVIVSAALIAAASCYLIYFSSRRYQYLREWVDNNLEPDWKKKTFKPDRMLFGPRQIYYLTQWLLVLIITIITLIEI